MSQPYLPYILLPSHRPQKKYKIINPNGFPVIHFGDKNYTDFTTNKNLTKQQNYLKRHAPNEDWYNLNTAGAWSRWLLWNKPNLIDAVKDMEKKFNIKIVVNV